MTALLVRDYNVLSASSGKEAVQLSENYQPAIHLLLSDFEMPEMNGIALATQISVERPQTKVLLMSGFTGGRILVLNEGWHFLPKPFIASQLHALIADLINPEESGRKSAQDRKILSEDRTDDQSLRASAYCLKRHSEVIDPRIAYDPDVIKTMLPHSAFGHRACRGCLNGIIAGHGADIVCDECGAVVRTVPEPQIEWALAQMQFTFDGI